MKRLTGSKARMVGRGQPWRYLYVSEELGHRPKASEGLQVGNWPDQICAYERPL